MTVKSPYNCCLCTQPIELTFILQYNVMSWTQRLDDNSIRQMMFINSMLASTQLVDIKNKRASIPGLLVRN